MSQRSATPRQCSKNKGELLVVVAAIIKSGQHYRSDVFPLSFPFECVPFFYQTLFIHSSRQGIINKAFKNKERAQEERESWPKNKRKKVAVLFRWDDTGKNNNKKKTEQVQPTNNEQLNKKANR